MTAERTPAQRRAKRMGADFEEKLAEYARTHGHPLCERRVMGGSRDRGDLAGIRGWVIEAKAEMTRRDVIGALREARKEAEHDGATRFAAVHKYTRQPIAEAVVSLPWWLFLELVLEVNADERRAS